MNRCEWSGSEKGMISYHDKEWGVPVHADKKLFEFLILEGAQAGLSWSTVLKKRPEYRKAFHYFDPRKVAKMTKRDVARLLKNPGIIRNRLKVGSTISNAKHFLRIQKEFGSFDTYIWSYVHGKPIRSGIRRLSDIPATTPLSERISKDMKKRGFRFVGSTIIYAYLQAIGMVNDHVRSCFRYREV